MHILDVNDDLLSVMIDSYANNILPCRRLVAKKEDINFNRKSKIFLPERSTGLHLTMAIPSDTIFKLR